MSIWCGWTGGSCCSAWSRPCCCPGHCWRSATPPTSRTARPITKAAAPRFPMRWRSSTDRKWPPRALSRGIQGRRLHRLQSRRSAAFDRSPTASRPISCRRPEARWCYWRLRSRLRREWSLSPRSAHSAGFRYAGQQRRWSCSPEPRPSPLYRSS